jgi:hypothetical protein
MASTLKLVFETTFLNFFSILDDDSEASSAEDLDEMAFCDPRCQPLKGNLRPLSRLDGGGDKIVAVIRWFRDEMVFEIRWSSSPDGRRDKMVLRSDSRPNQMVFR